MPPARASRKVTVDQPFLVRRLIATDLLALCKVSHSFPMNSKVSTYPNPRGSLPTALDLLESHTHDEQNNWKPAAGYAMNTQQRLSLQGLPHPRQAQTSLQLTSTPTVGLQTLNLRVHLGKKKITCSSAELAEWEKFLGQSEETSQNRLATGPTPSQSHLCPLLPNRAIGDGKKKKKKKPSNNNISYCLHPSTSTLSRPMS